MVWEQPSAAFRDITLFDGFAWVQVEGGQQLVVGPLDFTGFQTPGSGNVDAHVTVWATEGDRGITGDYMSLGNQQRTLRPADQAARRRSPGRQLLQQHDLQRRRRRRRPHARATATSSGFDLATLTVPEGTIGNDQTGASVCLGTTGDTYFFGGLVFDTLIKAPNLEISKVADHATANPGDVVNYTTTVANPSTRDHERSAARDAGRPRPPTSSSPTRFRRASTSSASPTTAAERAPTTRRHARSPATWERSQPDAKFTYSYNATVSAAAAGRQPRARWSTTPATTANSEDQPDVVFHGCDPATVVVPPAPPRQPADLGVVKTVSHNIVKPGDTLTWTVVGTNYGPATSTGFVLADQLPPGVQFVSATASPALTCTTPAVGDQRIRHLHRAERSRRAGRGVVADAHDRRNGARHHRRWHPPGQHRNRVRQRR